MFNSPANGRAGELFPSPAKGHTDDGLSGEQSSDAQTLIDSALGGYYPRGTIDNLLAGKQPTIGEGSLSQSKVQHLTSDLATKASSQQLADAIATRQPLIQDGDLTVVRTSGLQAALDEKARPAT